MPVFIRTSNLQFVIRTKDHPPAHVHVLGPGAEMKVSIENLQIIKSTGFSKKDASKILSFLKDKKELLVQAWEEYHEK
jgi:hypothetical protein